MLNKFYSFAPTWSRKWFLGEAVTTLDMGVLAKKSMRGFKGVVHVKIVSGTTPGDLLEVGLPLLVVSSKMLEIWEKFEKFETYPIIIKNRDLPIEYTGVTFLGRGGPFDPVKSKAVYFKGDSGDKKPAVMNMDGLYFDDSQWDGSDLLTVDDFPCHPIVTERVVKAMKKAKVTNCKYTLLEDYCFYKK